MNELGKTPAAAAAPTAGTATTARDQADLVASGTARLLGNYRQAPIAFVEGQGSTLVDRAGKRYLDFAAGVAVNALGHAHPDLTRAIADQAGKLVHVSNYFFNEENVLLAERLCATTGFDRAFFCNSGAEANEAMFKMARRHFSSQGKPEKYRMIAFQNSFHGRTVATVTLTGNASYSDGFGPKLGGIDHLPYGDLDAVARAMGDDVCAIFVEPIQGEGGVLPAPDGYLAGLRELADRHGALLLVDEIQTGVGRTGTFLGSAGVEADAISMAKGLAGGVPIGAMLVRERLNGALPPGTHGSTFGGNPLACRAARTVLEVVERDGLVEGARRKGALLGKFLAAIATKHAGLCEGERGRGLLRGLVLKKHVDARVALGKVRDAGVLLTIAGGSVLRFTPPLVVTEDELDEGCRRVDEALKGLAA